MFCVKCGTKISGDSRFCTGCGEKAALEFSEKQQGDMKRFWTRKKAILLILSSIVLSSLFWVFIWGADITSTEDEAVNILVHLIETVGRQKNAWEKTDQSIDVLFYALSDECVSDPSCVDDSVNTNTTLWAEVGKEREEIENLWSKGVLGQDLESYLSKLDEKNLGKILDVFNIYFPEESEELGPSESLL